MSYKPKEPLCPEVFLAAEGKKVIKLVLAIQLFLLYAVSTGFTPSFVRLLIIAGLGRFGIYNQRTGVISPQSRVLNRIPHRAADVRYPTRRD